MVMQESSGVESVTQSSAIHPEAHCDEAAEKARFVVVLSPTRAGRTNSAFRENSWSDFRQSRLLVETARARKRYHGLNAHPRIGVVASVDVL